MLIYNKLDKKTYKIYLKEEGKWIIVQRKAGVFHLIDNNLVNKKSNWVTDCTELCFQEWDDQVKNLDQSMEDCFNISNLVQWKQVVLRPYGPFNVEKIDTLCEALEHANLSSWCLGDM